MSRGYSYRSVSPRTCPFWRSRLRVRSSAP